MRARFAARSVVWCLLMVGATRTPMASAQSITAQWLNPIDGLWTDSEKWSTHPTYPNNGTPLGSDRYDVRIDAMGPAYRVESVSDVALDRLTIDSAAATVEWNRGTLATPIIRLLQGRLVLGNDDAPTDIIEAVIQGATILADAGQLQIANVRGTLPTFDGVSLGAPLTVPNSGEPRLLVRNGLELLDGTVLRIFEPTASLQFDGNQTLSGQGIVAFEQRGITTTAGLLDLKPQTTLTIGPGVEIRANTMSAFIGSNQPEGAPLNVGIVNQGRISASGTRSVGVQLLNQSVDRGVTFENQGVVEVSGDNEIVIGGDWSNTGVFRVRDNGRLYLAGRYSYENIGTIDRQGGRVFLAGEMLNEGRVLTANAATGDLILGGAGSILSAEPVVRGGRIESQEGGTWTFGQVALDNVALATNANVDVLRRVSIYRDLHLDNAQLTFMSTNSQRNSQLMFADIERPQAIRGTGTIEFATGLNGELSFGSELSTEQGVRLLIAGGRGRTSTIYGDTFINGGTIEVLTDSTLVLANRSTVNRGTVDISGRVLWGADDEHAWINEGTIRLRPGSSTTFRGSYKISDIGNLVDEGADEIQLGGVIDNQGSTLSFDELQVTVPLTINGATIVGGVLDNTTLTSMRVVNRMNLDGVTLAGNLTTDGDGSVGVSNNLILDGTTSAFPGRDVGFYGPDPQRLSGTGSMVLDGGRLRGFSLTIDQQVTIRSGTTAALDSEVAFLENRGRIVQESPNSTMTIGYEFEPWTNNGVIEMRDGNLRLQGAYTGSDVAGITNNGGELRFEGRWLNRENTISVNGSFGESVFRGEIDGGRIETQNGFVADLGGRWTDVTFAGEGALHDHEPSTGPGQLQLFGSFHLEQGSLSLGESTILRVAEPMRLEGIGEIVLAGSAANTAVNLTDGSEIGPGLTLRTSATGGGSINGISDGHQGVTNLGHISAMHLGQQIFLSRISNQGVLKVSHRAQLRISDQSWVNEGMIEIEDGFLDLPGETFENGEDGTITGHGTITNPRATLVNRGRLAPTASPNFLRATGNIQLTSEGEFVALLTEAYQSSSFSALRGLGSIELGGTLEVTKAEGYRVGPHETYTIISAFREVTGMFADLEEGALVGKWDGWEMFISYRGGRGQDVILFTVPEPDVLALFGLIPILHLARRRHCGRHRAVFSAPGRQVSRHPALF